MNTASYHNNQAIWTELLPGGHHWSGRIQKETILRFTSLGAQANVSLFCVNAADVLERFNMPDSLKRATHCLFKSFQCALFRPWPCHGFHCS